MVKDNINFQTPPEICKYMISLLPNNVKSVLEPTPGNGNILRELEKLKFDVRIPKDDFWDMPLKEYDSSVMNPPFTPMEEGYRILFKVMEHCNIIVALMPYLAIINSEKRVNKFLEFGLKSVTHLPRNVFKGSRVQTCILELNKNYRKETIYHFINKNFEVVK